MRPFIRIVDDERATSTVELALVMPFFAALIIGVVDLSRGFSAKLQLEQAAYRSIEKVQQYYTTESTYNTLQSEAATAAGVPVTNVTIDYWLECNGTRQTSYDTTCPNGQTYARWISVDIKNTFTPMFSSRAWPGANPDGTFTLHGKTALRTQ